MKIFKRILPFVLALNLFFCSSICSFASDNENGGAGTDRDRIPLTGDAKHAKYNSIFWGLISCATGLVNGSTDPEVILDYAIEVYQLHDINTQVEWNDFVDQHLGVYESLDDSGDVIYEYQPDAELLRFCKEFANWYMMNNRKNYSYQMKSSWSSIPQSLFDSDGTYASWEWSELSSVADTDFFLMKYGTYSYGASNYSYFEPLDGSDRFRPNLTVYVPDSNNFDGFGDEDSSFFVLNTNQFLDDHLTSVSGFSTYYNSKKMNSTASNFRCYGYRRVSDLCWTSDESVTTTKPCKVHSGFVECTPPAIQVSSSNSVFYNDYIKSSTYSYLVWKNVEAGDFLLFHNTVGLNDYLSNTPDEWYYNKDWAYGIKAGQYVNGNVLTHYQNTYINMLQDRDTDTPPNKVPDIINNIVIEIKGPDVTPTPSPTPTPTPGGGGGGSGGGGDDDDSFWDVLKGIFESLGDFIGKLISLIVDFFKGIVDGILEGVQTIFDFFFSDDSTIVSLLSSFFDWLPSPIPELLIGIFSLSCLFGLIKLIKGVFS